MPRLPRIMAEPSAPTVRYARAPYGGDGGAGAIAQASGEITRTLLRFASLEQDKKREEIKSEVGVTSARIEEEVAKGESDLQLLVTDPEEYRLRHERLVDDTIAAARKGTKNGETAAALDAKMAPFVGRSKANAYIYSNALFKKNQLAELDEGLDIRTRRAGLAKDDPEFKHQMIEAELLIRDKEAVLGGKDAVERAVQKVKQDMYLARAVREKNLTPEAFVATAESRYEMLDTRQREVLMEEARNKVEADRKARVTEEEKRQKKLEEIGEKNRQFHLAGFTIAAANKELSTGQVMRGVEEGTIVGPVETEHYLTLAKKGTAIESDQALWSEVQADVWSETPTYNEAKIRKLMVRAVEGGQGLSGEHGRMALTELNRKREAASDKGQTQENEQRRLANDAYNKAKEEGLMGLGITTPMSQLDKNDQKLAFDFVRAFNATVLDPSGNVRTDVQHRQVMYEVLPTFIARKSSDTRLNYQQQAGVYKDQTGSQVPDVLDPAFLQWYAKEVKATEALGADPKTLNLYKLRQQQLLQMSRTRNEYIQMEARKGALQLGGGGKSTGGYTAPKEPK